MINPLLRISIACLILACGNAKTLSLDQLIEKRPANAGAIVDRVDLLSDVRESTGRHLAAIKNRYGIEILIVAIPSLENRYTINAAAADLFTNWQIGKACDGRGMLLLFVDDQKKIKLEVSYDLEDVFTDAFTGHIQDVQLQPRYASGQLQVGFIAVMEALENRAQIKYGGNYTPKTIAAIDLDYLSQGAGAGRRLEMASADPAPASEGMTLPVNTAYPAGASPEEAWQTMIQSWRDRIKDPFLGVYTPVTRLAYRDFTNRPDSSLEKQYTTYASKRHTVSQDGDYAVIYFGRKKGWGNAPFLFCRTDEGWQFDIVHQRRFIRMGRAPDWGVEFAEHPHMKLLMDAFHFNGQDIPAPDGDHYTIADDERLAQRILWYEDRLKRTPDDPATLLELGRLYTIAAMGPKAIPLLKRFLKKSPNAPAAVKYLAIAHVDAYYQYDHAQDLLAEYIEHAPEDPFGHDFSGYIHYCQKSYPAARRAFERALAIDADDGYAHFYLTYTYAWLHAGASSLNPAKDGYRQRFRMHREKTRALAHPLRVAWLNRWLDKK